MRISQSLPLFCFSASLAQALVLDRPSSGKARSITKHARQIQRDNCQPFSFTFSQSDISRGFYTPFIGVSPPGTYETTEEGLEMFLQRPKGTINRQGYVNNVVGQGATINSTFTMLYSKITFEMKAPKVAGSVTAAILISDGHDEIDVELVPGDSRHWQTNVYAPSPKDMQPLWGVFGEVENYRLPSSSTSDYHNYTIDWTASRIIWSVDGQEVRTLKPSQTEINGTSHYPRQAARIQLGIWDASSPAGTSEWAKGPVNWKNTPSTISAIVKSVRIECD